MKKKISKTNLSEPKMPELKKKHLAGTVSLYIAFKIALELDSMS